MLPLKSTDLVSLISSAAADLDVVVGFASSDDPITPTSDVDCEPQLTNITTATTTTIAASPASGVRNVKYVNVRNVHASTTCDVTIQFNRSGTLYELIKVALLAGEVLIFDEGTWFHYDSNGGVYGQALPVASDTIAGGIETATQAEMEAGTSTVTAVTPGRMHYHPGSAKFWVIFTGNSTTITASYNVTSITDGTTEATVTIATDFSGSAWCVQATAIGTTSSAVANARLSTARSLAAGSVIVFCVDAAATPVIQDPTSWCVSGFGDHA